jgi:hypothetical protein
MKRAYPIRKALSPEEIIGLLPEKVKDEKLIINKFKQEHRECAKKLLHAVYQSRPGQCPAELLPPLF